MSPQRTQTVGGACVKCHSLNGTSSKAGPDLQFIGDKYPRRDLIQSVLEPSVVIAVGYGTTVVETKSGEEIQGVLKSATAESLELVGTDGRHVVVATRDIRAQHGTTTSLMPEGIEAGMTPQEFADLIEFLTTLRQPETAVSANRGLPSGFPSIAREPGATNLRAMDVNGDGVLDVVAGCGHGTGVFWLEGPSWKKHGIDGGLRDPHALAVGDFDSNGRPDVAVASFGAKRVRWYRNEGRGEFTAFDLDTDHGQEAYDLKAVDLDANSRLDLILAGRETRNAVWFRNTAAR